MDLRLQKAINTFSENVRLVYELMDFDRLVQDQALRILNEVQAAVDEQLKFTARLALDNGIHTLKNVRENDSLRPQYAHIFNQCDVLLVSYFDSAVRDIFRHLLQTLFDAGATDAILKTDFKVTVAELASFSRDDLAEMFIAKRDISFQDMQSISRAFKEYIGFEPPKDQTVNDIIVGHACRHVIVHAGAVVDRKLLGQVRSATPRTLKPTLVLGDSVKFSPPEIRHLGHAMERYVRSVANSGWAAVERHPRTTDVSDG